MVKIPNSRRRRSLLSPYTMNQRPASWLNCAVGRSRPTEQSLDVLSRHQRSRKSPMLIRSGCCSITRLLCSRKFQLKVVRIFLEAGQINPNRTIRLTRPIASAHLRIASQLYAEPPQSIEDVKLTVQFQSFIQVRLCLAQVFPSGCDVNTPEFGTWET